MKPASECRACAPPSVPLRNLHPLHWPRVVGPVQKLLPNGRPVLTQVAGEFLNGHPVDARGDFAHQHVDPGSDHGAEAEQREHREVETAVERGACCVCHPVIMTETTDLTDGSEPGQENYRCRYIG